MMSFLYTTLYQMHIFHMQYSVLLRGCPRAMFVIRKDRPSWVCIMEDIPGHDTVKTYAEHLLSEMEQLVHLEKKTKQAPSVPELPPTALAKPMVKNLEAPGGGRPQGGWKQGGNASASPGGGNQEGPRPCPFFLTDQGCRKGRSCTFSEDATTVVLRNILLDGDRPKVRKLEEDRGSEASGSPQKVKDVSRDTTTTSSPTTPSEKVTMGGDEKVMKDLMQEANKMLQSLSPAAKTGDTKQARLKELQEELIRLQKETTGNGGGGNAVRALRLARLQKEQMGLLDTGATHAMRGKRYSEIPQEDNISVTLAGGEVVPMCMNDQGTLIHDDPDVDPIVPVGRGDQGAWLYHAMGGHRLHLRAPGEGQDHGAADERLS